MHVARKKLVLGLSTLCSGLLMAGSAFAGTPVPAPIAGSLGPWGLGLAGVAYVGYRIYKHFRKR